MHFALFGSKTKMWCLCCCCYFLTKLLVTCPTSCTSSLNGWCWKLGDIVTALTEDWVGFCYKRDFNQIFQMWLDRSKWTWLSEHSAIWRKALENISTQSTIIIWPKLLSSCFTVYATAILSCTHCPKLVSMHWLSPAAYQHDVMCDRKRTSTCCPVKFCKFNMQKLLINCW